MNREHFLQSQANANNLFMLNITQTIIRVTEL